MSSVTNAGTLTVTPTDHTLYTVTAPTSCSGTTAQQLALEVPSLTASPTSAGVCPGSSTTLTVNSNVAGTTYTWTANGSPVGTGSSITVSPGATTTYRVTSSNPSGCSNTAFRDVPVTVAAASASVSPATATINPGSSATLLASASFSGATYTWRTGGSGGTVVSTGASYTASPGQTTTYTVTATAGSCTASRAVTVNVNGPLPVELTTFEAHWQGGHAAPDLGYGVGT